MPPENIDDLFREKLDGHASPPGADLWARLQAHVPADAAPASAVAPERLDQLFQKGLNQHATPPGRELWERLEDEHLRPRQRRAAAWWPMALAAAVALLLLVGGAGLWLGLPNGKMSASDVASQSPKTQKTGATAPVTSDAISADKARLAPEPQQQPVVAAATPEAASEENISVPEQKNATIQATRSLAVASNAPKASKAAREQSSRHLKGTNRPLDATTDQAQSVARTTTPPAAHPATSAADEHRKTLENAPVVAQVTKPTPTVEIVPATSSGLITVDVRNGDAPARASQTIASALAEAAAPAERRGLGGRLLQQAGHLVRGERLSLAEATGLPENVTLRATIAGRHVSKSIQL
ncbi:hypothetical protein Q5H92_14005 [Hymenobacter sp. M29]|uniref:Uncharacterized protein n=1 Tax=Hymenobacter mellowenesis TaxID=3063995 RepID=A0ABT9ACB2_9BACT|nr:hypothetical protein [Hymenobacter sp. M29]MDO7847480.1 hypothetical protein [Hymenobacter sp. M29]